MTQRAYLAGPEVFLPNPLDIAEAKKQLCAKYGLEGIFPLDASLDLAGLSKQDQGLKIGQANEALIRSCELLIANMTPFRGPSLDVGTAYEMGFARALGLSVFGYSNDCRPLVERTQVLIGATLAPDGKLRDDMDMEVEDFNMCDNLMIDAAVAASNSIIVIMDARKNPFTDLAGFEVCLRSIFYLPPEE